ncbi:424_t:CDS:2, partial [Racocetra fulgida]
IEYEAKFINISKAYKVLTNEETRRNFEEFGHPDGKQDLLSASIEFKELVEQRPTDNAQLSPIIISVKDELERRFGEKYEKSKRYNAPFCQKANALLYAHMLRVNIDDNDLLK